MGFTTSPMKNRKILIMASTIFIFLLYLYKKIINTVSCTLYTIYRYCEIINCGVQIFVDFVVYLNHENKNLTKRLKHNQVGIHYQLHSKTDIFYIFIDTRLSVVSFKSLYSKLSKTLSHYTIALILSSKMWLRSQNISCFQGVICVKSKTMILLSLLTTENLITSFK